MNLSDTRSICLVGNDTFYVLKIQWMFCFNEIDVLPKAEFVSVICSNFEAYLCCNMQTENWCNGTYSNPLGRSIHLASHCIITGGWGKFKYHDIMQLENVSRKWLQFLSEMMSESSWQVPRMAHFVTDSPPEMAWKYAPKVKTARMGLRVACLALATTNNYNNNRSAAMLTHCGFKVFKIFVQRRISRWKDTKSVEDRVRMGCPRITTKVQDKELKVVVKINPTCCLKELQAIAKKSNKIAVSADVLASRIKEWGCVSIVRVIQPLVTKKNRPKRVFWAKNHRDYNFANVVFADEADVTLGVKGHKRKWLPKGFRERNQNFIRCPQKPINLLIWGAIGRFRSDPLYIINGTMNFVKYKNTLSKGFHAISKKQISIWTFQHDNSKVYMAHIITAHLRACKAHVLDWPACSPHINPIENVWSNLKERIQKHHPSTKEELVKFSTKEWKKLAKAEVRKCLTNMSTLEAELIHNHAYSTRPWDSFCVFVCRRDFFLILSIFFWLFFNVFATVTQITGISVFSQFPSNNYWANT